MAYPHWIIWDYRASMWINHGSQVGCTSRGDYLAGYLASKCFVQVLVGEQLPTEGTIWKVGMLIWLCPEMLYTGMPQNCYFDGILIWGHAFGFAFNELFFYGRSHSSRDPYY